MPVQNLSAKRHYCWTSDIVQTTNMASGGDLKIKKQWFSL